MSAAIKIRLKAKRCKSCGERKPASEFHRHKWHVDGLQPYCKPCNVRASTTYIRNRRMERLSKWAALAVEAAATE